MVASKQGRTVEIKTDAELLTQEGRASPLDSLQFSQRDSIHFFSDSSRET